MQDHHLIEQDLLELRAAHRSARNSREAYRLNAVILLGSGWGPVEVASALSMDDDTLRIHTKRYKQGGLAALTRMSDVGRMSHLAETGDPAVITWGVRMLIVQPMSNLDGERFVGGGLTRSAERESRPTLQLMSGQQ